MKGYVNFGDISKTIPGDLCNMGGSSLQQRKESIDILLHRIILFQ